MRENPDRRIFDCVLYNGEWQLLLLRLNELAEFVEKFIIVEAKLTFSGKPKELKFPKDSIKFTKFSEKIEYVVIDSDESDFTAWEREEYQRNYVSNVLSEIDPNDVILLSDVDEIPYAPSLLTILDSADKTKFGLQMKLKYFAFDYENVSGPESEALWAVAFSKGSLLEYTPEQLRMGIRRKIIESEIISHSGEHLSYFMQKTELIEKIQSFSHQEFNVPEFHNRLNPKKIIENRDDLFLRAEYKWEITQLDQKFDFVNKNPIIYKEFFSDQILNSN